MIKWEINWLLHQTISLKSACTFGGNERSPEVTENRTRHNNCIKDERTHRVFGKRRNHLGKHKTNTSTVKVMEWVYEKRLNPEISSSQKDETIQN